MFGYFHKFNQFIFRLFNWNGIFAFGMSGQIEGNIKNVRRIINLITNRQESSASNHKGTKYSIDSWKSGHEESTDLEYPNLDKRGFNDKFNNVVDTTYTNCFNPVYDLISTTLLRSIHSIDLHHSRVDFKPQFDVIGAFDDVKNSIDDVFCFFEGNDFVKIIGRFTLNGYLSDNA